MKKVLTLTLFLAAVCVPLAVAADILVTINVSPDTIVLEEGVDEHGLTVHAEISYHSVADVVLDDGTNVYDPYLTKPDLRGELVAKFRIPAGNLEKGTLPLLLSGTTVGGDTFYGSDEIWVIEKNDGGPGSDKHQNQNGNREGQQG
ncbi:MAG: hypothetical protein JSV99_08510 [Planctomycetota bacterium]|nr:MAG: hypothetical protein JSV99_08510 [Planctomycetota bacterium]